MTACQLVKKVWNFFDKLIRRVFWRSQNTVGKPRNGLSAAVYLIEAGLDPLKLPRCCGGFCWLPVFLTVSLVFYSALGISTMPSAMVQSSSRPFAARSASTVEQPALASSHSVQAGEISRMTRLGTPL